MSNILNYPLQDYISKNEDIQEKKRFNFEYLASLEYLKDDIIMILKKRTLYVRGVSYFRCRETADVPYEHCQ